MKPGWQGRGLGQSSAGRIEPKRTRFTRSSSLECCPHQTEQHSEFSRRLPKHLHFHNSLSEVTHQLHVSLVSP